MNIPEYIIGITIPAVGLSDRQMMSVIQRLRFLDKSLTALDAKLVLKVAGTDVRKPERLPPQVEKILQYRTTARVEHLGPLTTLWPHQNLESFLWYQFKECDEVWCFSSGGSRKERANRLYRYAIDLGWKSAWQNQARPETRYKLIPPWVEIESEPSKKQRKGNATNGTHGRKATARSGGFSRR